MGKIFIYRIGTDPFGEVMKNLMIHTKTYIFAILAVNSVNRKKSVIMYTL